MGIRINKIKKHFHDNKKIYAVGSTCLGVGAVLGGVAIVRSSVVDATVIQGIAYRSPVTQKIDVFVEALGDPGNIIQDVTTGTIYASQNQAARELGVSPARISEHLTGKILDVKGHTLTKLGKAMVAE